MRDTLPAIFSMYASQVQYVQKRGPNQWTSTCPKCGGSPHQDGTLPDRCFWTPVGRNGKASGYCRKCETTFWTDSKREDDANLDPTERRLRAIEEEQQRQKDEQRAQREMLERHERYIRELQAYRDGEIWQRYHDQMGNAGRQYWSRERGLSEFWQDFWQLGYWPNSVWGVPTATIPIFGKGWEPVNMKHRLIGSDRGKYRYEVKGAAAPPLFLCDPAADIAGHVYAIEGELKAAVTYSRLQDAKAVIVGLPGIESNATTIAPLLNADRVTLVVDPGAKRQGIEMARKIGLDKCWLLEPPFKIDDGLLAANATAGEVRRLLRSADRISAFVTGR